MILTILLILLIISDKKDVFNSIFTAVLEIV